MEFIHLEESGLNSSSSQLPRPPPDSNLMVDFVNAGSRDPGVLRVARRRVRTHLGKALKAFPFKGRLLVARVAEMFHQKRLKSE